jgi:hypothetical protein
MKTTGSDHAAGGTLKIKTLTCPTCKRDLTVMHMVTREYIAKNPKENENSYCTGHYNKDGNFEPDGKPSYPVVNHDLLDGSDSCTNCTTVVG